MLSLPGRSNWTTKELLAFNIRVVDATVSSFFASTELPPVSVSPVILDNLHIPGNGHLSKNDRHFFQYLKAVEQASSEDSAVADFAALILSILDYDDEDRRRFSSIWWGRELTLRRTYAL